MKFFEDRMNRIGFDFCKSCAEKRGTFGNAGRGGCFGPGFYEVFTSWWKRDGKREVVGKSDNYVKEVTEL